MPGVGDLLIGVQPRSALIELSDQVRSGAFGGEALERMRLERDRITALVRNWYTLDSFMADDHRCSAMAGTDRNPFR